MLIEAELDDLHAERLLELQRQINKPLSDLVLEILTRGIDGFSASQESEGQKIYRLFDEAGLVGCMEGDGNLSVDYKEHLWGNE